MIDSLDFEGFAQLYKERVKADFPINERRPLAHIKKQYLRGGYRCLVLRDAPGGPILAYAGLVLNPAVRSVLIDIFAVDATLRGGGVGSRFITGLKASLDTDGILLECEMPGKAKTEADRETRLRRIAFYQRLGAQTAQTIGWRAFGVDYNLLWLPVKAAMDEARLGRDIQVLYEGSMAPARARRNTRLYPLGPEGLQQEGR